MRKFWAVVGVLGLLGLGVSWAQPRDRINRSNCCGVSSSGGTTTINNYGGGITSVDGGDGLRINALADGGAQLVQLPASTTSPGYVTTGSQSFYGIKNFASDTTGNMWQSASPSGGYALKVTINGARVDLGLGSGDYLYSDGTGIRSPAPLTVANLDAGTIEAWTEIRAPLAVVSFVDAGTVQVQPGAGTDMAKVGGVLNMQSTTTGNVGAGEDTLHTYTLPANTLNTTNRGLRFAMSGAFANNANAKTFKFYVGGSTVFNVSLPTSISGRWILRAELVRSGSNVQVIYGTLSLSDEADNIVDTIYQKAAGATETDTATIVIKVTAEAVADNDVEQYTSLVAYQ